MSCLFHYDSFNVAIRVPMNVISYNTWLSYIAKHSTGLTFTYDSDFVYLSGSCVEQSGLYLPAWGGSSTESSDKAARNSYIANYLRGDLSSRHTVAQFANLLRERRCVCHARRLGAINNHVQRALDRQS